MHTSTPEPGFPGSHFGFVKSHCISQPLVEGNASFGYDIEQHVAGQNDNMCTHKRMQQGHIRVICPPKESLHFSGDVLLQHVPPHFLVGPKQWSLTSNETITSIEAWENNLKYILSLDSNFAGFLTDGSSWGKKMNASPLRGFTNDPETVPVAQRRTAAQKTAHLEGELIRRNGRMTERHGGMAEYPKTRNDGIS
ncbi:hypothetical protein ACROYT_G023088 [Oculina patagonica]